MVALCEVNRWNDGWLRRTAGLRMIWWLCVKESNTQEMNHCCFKGAVCRILTLLKHKNTIICLQIFKKHAKLTYLFIWKTMQQSVILLWKCAFRPGMSVFVIVCETRPLPVYPIVFRHRRLPVGGKHRVFNFIHRHVRSFLLVSLIWHLHVPQVWGGGAGEKKTSPIFWIWTAIPSSTARLNLHTAPLRKEFCESRIKHHRQVITICCCITELYVSM